MLLMLTLLLTAAGTGREEGADIRTGGAEADRNQAVSSEKPEARPENRANGSRPPPPAPVKKINADTVVSFPADI
jgi:hypothetical protein